MTGERPEGMGMRSTGSDALCASFEEQRMSDTWRRVALVADGFEILVNFMRPGGALPMHEHAHRQIGFCFSGGFELALDGPALPLRPGDSYRLASKVRHGARIEADTVSLDLKYCAPADDGRAREAAVVSPGLSPSDGQDGYSDRWIYCGVVRSEAGLEHALGRVREFPAAYLVAVDRATPRAAIYRAPPAFAGAEQTAKALLVSHDVTVIGHRTPEACA